MLESQNDKILKNSNPHSQEINPDWKKYNKRIHNLNEYDQIKNQYKIEKRVRTKNSKLAIISAIEILLIVLIAIPNTQYFNSPVSSISKKASGTPKNEFPLKPSAGKTESTDHQLTTIKNKTRIRSNHTVGRE